MPYPRRFRFHGKSFRFEPLEPRQMLAAELMITEFLARNDAGLRDANGRSSDWVEIYNAGDTAASLEGFHLTDDPAELSKWRFPAVSLGPGEYRVVFASGQEAAGYVDSGGYLHANFTLRRGGEYLGLVSPNGQIVSEFGSRDTDYPEQLTNVSYGVAQKATLLDANSDVHYWRPLGGQVDGLWTAPAFDASANGFTNGKAAIGFESRPDDRRNFSSVIQTSVAQRSQGVYVRLPFELEDARGVRELHLGLQYDNGFVAYLNGTEVARDNAPNAPSWFSQAPEVGRNDSDSLEFVEFDLGQHLDALVDGKNVLAIHVLNNLGDDSDLLLVPKLIAVIPSSSDTVGFMPEPTPGSANGESFEGFVSDTKFSVDRGFYNEPQLVEITTDTQDATIYHTTNGTVPSPSNPDAMIYTDPLTISETTVLRVAAFKMGFLPTNADTQTYIFIDDVIGQNVMRTSVTEDPVWGPQLRDSLLAIPTVSLAAGDSTILRERALTREIATSIELIMPDGSDGFQIDAGLEHFGGHTLSFSPKKNLRLSFKSQYGPPNLEFDLFGEGAANEFDQLLLRTGSHDNWFWTHPQGNRGIYIRNRWASDAQLAMGQPAPHGRFVHVYIDGTYWGMHQLMERPNAAFMASYFGGDKEDYDALNAGTPVDGDRLAYTALRTTARGDDYDELLKYFDPVNYADYMLLQFYGGNDWDWNTEQNWMAARKRQEGEGWKFFSWDSDLVLRTWTDPERSSARVNVINRGGPGSLWRNVKEHDEFLMVLADRAQRHFFNDGVLTTDRVTDQLAALADEIRLPIIAESARWNRAASTQAYTQAVWEEHVNRVISQVVPNREQIVIDQMRDADVFPLIDAPSLTVNGVAQHGGLIADGSRVSLVSTVGTVYFTLDGSDPRMRGGDVLQTATEFSEAFTVTGGQSVKARTLHDGQWSALTEATFQLQSDMGLRITEINYSPYQGVLPGLDDNDAAADALEFVELTNVTNAPLDLNGIRLIQDAESGKSTDVAFTFTSQLLAPGEYIVVVRDVEAFTSQYGNDIRIAAGRAGLNEVAGQFEGDLSDRGEQITLVDSKGQFIHHFSYGVGRLWPERADGRGSSLEVINTEGNYNDPGNWRSSKAIGGSPGRPASVTGRTVVINEVLPGAPTPGDDTIELHNLTNRPIDVSNWYISDNEEDYFGHQIPASTTIPPRGYHVLTESELGLSLNSARGGDVWLIEVDSTGRPLAFTDEFSFGPTATGVSVGRIPERGNEIGPLETATFGQANSQQRVGEVIFSEVHFNPADPDGPDRPAKADNFEFIELYNRTDQAINLSDWRIEGSVEFDFTRGTRIGPHETLVVVSFRSTSTSQANIFRFFLETDLTLPLFGRYRTKLDNQANNLRLVRQETSPPDEPRLSPDIVVDQVDFSDTAPWPAFTEGVSHSLTRTSANEVGINPIAWRADKPTPGSVDFTERLPGDANEDGLFDQRDIELIHQRGKYLTGQPVRWDEGDFNGDGLFNQLDIVAALQFGGYSAAPTRFDDLIDQVIADF